MSMLTVDNVTHMFGDKTIFRNISFRLLRGEHAGLVGSNGAGKSTLLRILAGETLPDAGNVEWHPHSKVGYLQQHIELRAGTTMRQYLQSAFAHLYEIEQSMLLAAEKMAAGEHAERWIAQFGELQSMLEQADFYRLDAKMEEVAAGLGMIEIGLDRDVAELSGGQRTKLLLGKLLLEEPHVLLLDEPTNYLDDKHIEWLTTYLKSYEHAYMVVSHDERFLNEITTAIYHLEHQSLKRYTGNYKSFLRNYEQSRQQLQEAYERQQKEIVRLESFIQKNKVRKAKQAKSREKALERIERIDRPTSAPQPRFAFRVHAAPVSRIVEARNIRIGYTEPLFGPIDVQVNRGDKIAVVGYNGIGKSTMLKTLLGLMEPLSGTVQLGERVKPAYFAQEDMASSATALEQVWSLRPDLTQRQIRQNLAMSGLTDKHIRQPLHSLSGGEQAKVRLCELMLTDSNVLVLDEPTNHLDVRAKAALRQALIDYEGTILLVSHEPEFYADWVTQVWKIEDWRKE
ncbi:ABC-F family ATP-binding cassette domain-containing protein [Paenibacillus sp. MSJ-34]|uniref:ABC-F family ATP-binding cassette domain-containing protein n=1 Tax=Paenibacillus sp. MSJ-34 TaxID=2841529 RepID=UPI001C11F57B|nr:ABC-F family ATP-binding cassette domain-containing protein [Paenibacillus sp. MSJ-34]MBU5444419.1 ATP-binding cassette domain-containing protein [Paenibacillus sp. MSJ-34]